MPPSHNQPAGDFSAWLSGMLNALRTNGETEVACGDCIGCCSSSYFIHLKPTDTLALARIGKERLFPAPGLPQGNLLMGYDKEGRCPMLSDGRCSIYAQRPQTCRSYDCRVFTAAGISAGGKEKATINQRVKEWQFSYPSALDRQQHEAVRAAARIFREHAECFPGGRVQTDPSQLAILALKVYTVFLDVNGIAPDPRNVAQAIIKASRDFDEMQA